MTAAGDSAPVPSHVLTYPAVMRRPVTGWSVADGVSRATIPGGHRVTITENHQYGDDGSLAVTVTAALDGGLFWADLTDRPSHFQAINLGE